MKKIGILGSGIVARTLGDGFLKHGYAVMLGSRTPEKLAEWQEKAGANANTGSFADAAKFGEILVLAVKGKAAPDVIDLAGPKNLIGKTVIDTTNPVADKEPEDGVLHFFTCETEESLLEELQERFPAAHFVKAFNSVGAGQMVNPEYKEGKPSMFICGNNDKSKKETSEILDLFGWEVADMGKATAARAIEPLCMLWCIPGFRENKWGHAFKLIGL